MNQLMLFGAGAGAGAFLEVRQGLPLGLARLGEDVNRLPQNTGTNGVSLKGISISPDNKRAVVFSMPSGYAAYGDTRDFSARESNFSISNVCAAFARDGDYIVCGDAPYLIVKEWDGGNLRSYDTTGLGRVDCACLSHDRQRLFLAHSQTKVRAYDLASGDFVDASGSTPIYEITGSYANNRFHTMCATKSGAYLFINKFSRTSNSVQRPYTGILDAATLDTVRTLTLPDVYASSVIPHPHEEDSVIMSLGALNSTDGALLAVNCREGTMRYALNDAAFVAFFPGVNALQVSHIVYNEQEDELWLFAQNGTTIKLLALDARTLAVKREVFMQEEGAKSERFISSYLQSLAFIRRDGAQITGTVRASNNAPCARTVRAYRRSDGALMAQTVSDQTTGDYTLQLPKEDTYDVQFQALPSEELNDLFFARVTPEPQGA